MDLTPYLTLVVQHFPPARLPGFLAGVPYLPEIHTGLAVAVFLLCVAIGYTRIKCNYETARHGSQTEKIPARNNLFWGYMTLGLGILGGAFGLYLPAFGVALILIFLAAREAGFLWRAGKLAFSTGQNDSGKVVISS